LRKSNGKQKTGLKGRIAVAGKRLNETWRTALPKVDSAHAVMIKANGEMAVAIE
jgi:hypothetical protein